MIALLNLRPYTGDFVAPSPNQGSRRAPVIQGIVLHATADEGNEAGTLSWLRSPKSQASCHLLVSRNGRVTRLVGDRQRAWHAGLALWRGTHDVNSVTLGIEIANRNDGEPYTDAQYRRVAEIVAHYCRQGLSLDDVVSHGEIAAGRRTDPVGWDWDRFHAMVQQRLWPADFLPPLLPTAQAPAPVKEAAPVVPVVASRVAAAPKPPVSAMTAATARTSTVAAPKRGAVAMAASKPVLHSRTLWLNGFTVLASGGMLVGETLDLAHRVGITLPEVLTKWALFLVGLVNILLRLRTTQPLSCGCSDGVDQSLPEASQQRAQAQLVMAREARPQGGGRKAPVIQTSRGVHTAVG